MSLAGKLVLVSGADGFIGSHLVEQLLSVGARVRAVSCYNSFNYYGWLEEIPAQKELEIVAADLRDPYYCQEICRDCAIIFHLAALIAIPFSYRSVQSYLQTNLLGTQNLLQAALNNQVELFLHISTSEVYGSAIYTPIDEKHPLQPQSPYAASKVAADALVYSYYCSYDLPVVIARPFNNYGPRQSARAIIPTIFTQLAAGAKQIVLGNITPRRDFLFVKDNCRALLALAECPQAIGETVNIGSGKSISIAELLSLIGKISGREFEVAQDRARLRPEKSEVQVLEANTQKLNQLTSFQPKVNLVEGLQITWEWFQKSENLRRYKPEIYNL